MGTVRAARRTKPVERRPLRREKQRGKNGSRGEAKEPELVPGPLGPRALMLLALFFDDLLADRAGMLPVEGHRKAGLHPVAVRIAEEHPGPGGPLPEEPVAPGEVAGRQEGEQDPRFSHQAESLHESPPSVNGFSGFFLPDSQAKPLEPVLRCPRAHPKRRRLCSYHKLCAYFFFLPIAKAIIMYGT